MLKRANRPILWVVVGLIAGAAMTLTFGRPDPAFATATDHSEDFSIATGPVAETLEAVYILDFRTSRLRASVINRQYGKFLTLFERDLSKDFGLGGRMRPRFIMVTGTTGFAGRMTQYPVLSILYVAEVNSGKMVAYYLPYSGENVRGSTVLPIWPLDGFQFRPETVIREQ